MKKVYISVIVSAAIILISGCSITFRQQSPAPVNNNQPSDQAASTSQEIVMATTTELATSSETAVAAEVDSDQDGLSDAQEALYHTDKLNPDTDGDGYSDGEEVKGGFNPLGVGKLTVIKNGDTNIFLESLTSLDKFGSFETIKINLREEMMLFLDTINEAQIIDIAKILSTSSAPMDIRFAREVIAEHYSYFPHTPVLPDSGMQPRHYVAQDFQSLVSPYLVRTKKDSSDAKYFGFSGGFAAVESDRLYKYRQAIFASSKCGQKGAGFMDGLVTKDAQFYIIGAGCYQIDDNGQATSFATSSLAGYVWRPEVFRSTSTVPDLSPGQAKSRDLKRLADINMLRTALEIYYSDNNRYPSAEMVVGGSAIASSGTVFLAKIPVDPSPSIGICAGQDKDYTYTVNDRGDPYGLNIV